MTRTIRATEDTIEFLDGERVVARLYSAGKFTALRVAAIGTRWVAYGAMPLAEPDLLYQTLPK